MDIGEGCDISFSARLDKTHPRGIHLGDQLCWRRRSRQMLKWSRSL
jgi:hypothetical protein